MNRPPRTDLALAVRRSASELGSAISGADANGRGREGKGEGDAAAALASQLTGLDDGAVVALLRDVEHAGRVIDALRVAVAGELAERSRVELAGDSLARRLGHSTPAHLLEQHTRVSPSEAARRLRLAAGLRPRRELGGRLSPPSYPAVAEAVAEGEVGADAARAIIRCLDSASSSADPADVDRAERALVDVARSDCADLVSMHALAWREAIDPDGAEPRDEDLRQRRGFTLGRETNGMTRGTLVLDPQSAALVRSMLSHGTDPGREPQFIDEADERTGTTVTPTPDGDLVETLADPRTREQRRLDVLIGTITAGLRSRDTERAVPTEAAPTGAVSTGAVPRGAATAGPGSLRPMTAVMAVITLDELRSGVGAGWLDDVTEPVSAPTVRTMACDAGFRPVLVGDAGEILHFGRTRRLFSAAQRKALAVRDGGCVWPRCMAPPSWCEAHHVTEWEHGGTTDIANGALLCSAHHHLLHASAFTMRMFAGRPRLLAPPWLDPDQVWRPLGRNRALMTALRR
ncbi:DUF222 domain-containing protein [Marisediminicola sp. LYQ134]|uniref:HNH endonuclease signature motif containing protein n=1 Tax=Marisediminicola sp. LYQ134 TaxID=3391061 RepID=UPI003983015C